MKFLDLEEKIKIDRCTIPQAVFSTLNPDDETSEQRILRQEKFLKLPEAVKDKLVSNETANKIKAIGEHYGLSLLQMAPIARVIRGYYFGEVKLESMASIIERESKISKENAENVAKYLAERIIGKAVSPLANAVKTEKMTVSKALETYPNIRNQKITSSPLEIDGNNVSPTVDNWINDYYGVVGAGNRDIVKRSSYLYHSRNVKNLSSTDRQKLSLLLRSLDEGTAIEINSSTKEVYFNPSSMQVVNQSNALENKQKVAPLSNLQKNNEKNIFRREGVKIENDKSIIAELKDDSDKKSELEHVHGNDLDLGSIHFKEDKKGGGILNFFNRKKNNDKGLSFSFSQQLSSEKDKSNAGVEKKDLGKITPKGEDFFGKITPIEK